MKVRTMGSNVEKLLSWADVIVTDAASSVTYGLDVNHIAEKYPAMIIAEIQEGPGEYNLQAKTGMVRCIAFHCVLRCVAHGDIFFPPIPTIALLW